MNAKRLVIAGFFATFLAGSLVYAQSSGSSSGSSSSDTMTPGPGQSSRTMEKGTSTSAQNLRTLTMTVKNTDPKNHKVTFEAQVSPEANIMESGKPIALDQLKEGDMVRASFDPQSNELVKVQVIRSNGSSSSSGQSNKP